MEGSLIIILLFRMFILWNKTIFIKREKRKETTKKHIVHVLCCFVIGFFLQKNKMKVCMMIIHCLCILFFVLKNINRLVIVQYLYSISNFLTTYTSNSFFFLFLFLLIPYDLKCLCGHKYKSHTFINFSLNQTLFGLQNNTSHTTIHFVYINLFFLYYS